MKNKNLTPRQRKTAARLERELSQMVDQAYAMDGGEYDDQRYNDRYNEKYRQLKAIIGHNQINA